MNKMFPEYIYKLADYMQSGQHFHNNMVEAKDSGITFPESNNKKINYANAIMTIAKNAKVIIEPETKIIGSTYYKDATRHIVPFLNKPSVSHTTIDFKIVVDKGLNYLKNKILSQLTESPSMSCKEHSLSEKHAFWEAQLMCIEAMEIWHERYLEKLKELGKEDIISYFENVPMNPSKSFKEAVESLFFTFAFVRLCGNWPGIGRIDEILYPYYKQDLETGKITFEEAREFLANMWVKGCEWAWGYDTKNYIPGSGDAQHYQNIVLAGINKDGNEICNDITYMVLDIAQELSVSDFPISVRINESTPQKLHKRVAEVIKQGGGIVATYNEEIIIKSLTRLGYSLEEARCFANDGCWEAIIPGKTHFLYWPFDILNILQTILFGTKNYTDFDTFYKDFEETLREVFKNFKKEYYEGWVYPKSPIDSAPLISIFVEGCIESGKDYHENGPKYTIEGIHAGGIANAADSLTALKKFVFDTKEYTFTEYRDIIKNNWENHTDLRVKALNSPKYGNDASGDEMAVKIFNSFTRINEEIQGITMDGQYLSSLPKKLSEVGFDGVIFVSGISTFGREIEWLSHRKATADGHLKGEILAGNMSPSPGCDMEGPTALMKSYCKLDFTKLPNIGPLDMKLHPNSVKGEKGTDAIIALNKSLVELGGCFLQINVIDKETLLDAQKHPEKHPNLSVRVSGWNARFATLEKQWQDMVIQRTEIQI